MDDDDHPDDRPTPTQPNNPTSSMDDLEPPIPDNFFDQDLVLSSTNNQSSSVGGSSSLLEQIHHIDNLIDDDLIPRAMNNRTSSVDGSMDDLEPLIHYNFFDQDLVPSSTNNQSSSVGGSSSLLEQIHHIDNLIDEDLVPRAMNNRTSSVDGAMDDLERLLPDSFFDQDLVPSSIHNQSSSVGGSSSLMEQILHIDNLFDENLVPRAMNNQTPSVGVNVPSRAPFNAASGIGCSHWNWSIYQPNVNPDTDFQAVQEANTISKAAYQEFLRIALEVNSAFKRNIQPPLLGSIDDIQQMFQSQSSPETSVDLSTESVVLPISSADLRAIMFNMDDWAQAFSHILFLGYQCDPPNVLKELINTDATIKRMLMVNAEFYLPTPFVKRHKFCFLRCLREIITDIWVIVDVSVEYFGLNPNILFEEKCRRRPSGLIIRGHDHHSEVVWVENMEWCESHLQNCMYSDIMGSNRAFSAKRWVNTLKWWLKRNRRRFINPDRIQVDKRVDASLLRLTASMKKAYVGFTTGYAPHSRWESLSRGDVRIWGDTVATNRYVAMTSFYVQAKPTSVYNFLETSNTRLQWRSSLNLGEPEILLASVPEDPDVCITVHRKQILQSESSEEFECLLQEGSHDGFCSYVLSNFMTQQEADGLIVYGVCNSDIEELQPSGFAVVPDGSDGSLITVVMHQVVDTPETREAIESMEALLRCTIDEIRAGISDERGGTGN